MATTHARLRDRARSRRAIAVVAAAAALIQLGALVMPATAGASTASAYGWPVKPFDRQHPVRGFFGDPRIGMTPKGMHSGFHFGIDISCPNGTPVYATLDGRSGSSPSDRRSSRSSAAMDERSSSTGTSVLRSHTARM